MALNFVKDKKRMEAEFAKISCNERVASRSNESQERLLTGHLGHWTSENAGTASPGVVNFRRFLLNVKLET
jgi:hypothetical protein